MKTPLPKIVYGFPIFLGLGLKANAQDIVVNEYFNTAAQSDEWTELVVVKDLAFQ